MPIQSRRAGFLAGLLALLITGAAGSALAQDETGGEMAADPAETACDLGDGSACLGLGERLFLGQGGGADVARALELFARACDLDVALACFRLGAEREFPDFGMPDAEGALDAYTRACALGLESGCGRAGIEAGTAELEEAETLPTDNTGNEALPPPSPLSEDAGRDAPVIVTAAAPPAEDGFLEAALLDDFASEALPDLDFGQPAPTDAGPGIPLERDPVEGDETLTPEMAEAPAETSEEELLAQERQDMAEACGRGEMTACEMFAAWLRDGTGGPADTVRARRIFSVICTEGSLTGCYELGWMMYDAGTDELELSRARFLFSETCKGGVMEACLQAGDMRRNGEGGRVDMAGAARLYAAACEAGLEAGCLMAGPQSAGDAPEPAEAETVDAEAGIAAGPEAAAPEDAASSD